MAFMGGFFFFDLLEFLLFVGMAFFVFLSEHVCVFGLAWFSVAWSLFLASLFRTFGKGLVEDSTELWNGGGGEQ